MKAYRVTITAIVVDDGDGDPGEWDVSALLSTIKQNTAAHKPAVESVLLVPYAETKDDECQHCGRLP